MSTDTLKPKELKFIKAKLQGKNNTQAAMIATGTTNKQYAAVAANRMIKNDNIQAQLAKELDKMGITLKKAIKPIKDGLQATKQGMDKETGEYFDSGLPEHATRLKASAMALELLGAKDRHNNHDNQTPPFNPALLTEALNNGDEIELQRIIFNKPENPPQTA